MVGVDAKDVLEVAPVQDQQPIEALGTDGADEPLGDCVRLRRPHRRLHDPDAFAAEDLVEGAGVLAVAIADEEAHAAVAEVEAEVARLLGHPLPGRVPRAAGNPDTTARMRDEEEDVEAAQHDRLNSEEVTRDDAGRLRPQELAPARAAAARRRLETSASEKPPDARR